VSPRGVNQKDISLWSFRWRGILCFALVPPLTSRQSSSSNARRLC